MVYDNYKVRYFFMSVLVILYDYLAQFKSVD